MIHTKWLNITWASISFPWWFRFNWAAQICIKWLNITWASIIFLSPDGLIFHWACMILPHMAKYHLSFIICTQWFRVHWALKKNWKPEIINHLCSSVNRTLLSFAIISLSLCLSEFVCSVELHLSHLFADPPLIWASTTDFNLFFACSENLFDFIVKVLSLEWDESISMFCSRLCKLSEHVES